VWRREVRASEAFGILAILSAFIMFVCVAVGFWKRDDTGVIARFRIPFMGATGHQLLPVLLLSVLPVHSLRVLTVFWTVLTMIMWADLFRKYSSQDVEYGGGFAICITVWVIAALWIVGSYTKGSASSAAVATGAATGGGM
jgi:hypothetical protein